MLKKSIFLICILLFLDQLLKFYIKTNFYIGQEQYLFGHFFRLYFIENNGMAFGFEFGGNAGKLVLSSIRIVAVSVISYILYQSIKKKEHPVLILCLCLILAGATGNIIDSAFYGLIFSESNFLQVAELFPANGGYAGFLRGKVVDMFYAPIIKFSLPPNFPIAGGKEFEFFKPIFNLADSYISIGVVLLLLFYNKIFKKKHPAEEKTQTDLTDEIPVEE